MMIELTDHAGRLITIDVFYSAPGDPRAAVESVLKMLEEAQKSAPALFTAPPALVL